jgi:hypothetical protein
MRCWPVRVRLPPAVRRPCSPTGRGARLKSGSVWVRLPPRAPALTEIYDPWMRRHTDLYYVLFAFMWILIGIVGSAILIMVFHPEPFSRPFVRSATTTTSSTTTTVKLGKNVPADW